MHWQGGFLYPIQEEAEFCVTLVYWKQKWPLKQQHFTFLDDIGCWKGGNDGTQFPQVCVIKSATQLDHSSVSARCIRVFLKHVMSVLISKYHLEKVTFFFFKSIDILFSNGYHYLLPHGNQATSFHMNLKLFGFTRYFSCLVSDVFSFVFFLLFFSFCFLKRRGSEQKTTATEIRRDIILTVPLRTIHIYQLRKK